MKIRFLPNSFFKIFLDIVILGGLDNRYLRRRRKYQGVALDDVDFDDVEMLSIVNDSVVLYNTAIPFLPKHFLPLTGAQLPNGNLLVRGISRNCDEHLLFRDGSNQWTKIRSSERALSCPSSVWIDGRFFTTGFKFCFSSGYEALHHEEFTFNGSVKQRRKLPIGLENHSATVFGQQKILVSGGFEIYVSYRFLNHKTNCLN